MIIPPRIRYILQNLPSSFQIQLIKKKKWNLTDTFKELLEIYKELKSVVRIQKIVIFFLDQALIMLLIKFMHKTSYVTY